MHSKAYVTCAVLASLAPASLVQAAPAAGDREITIQGTAGTSSNDLDNKFFSASGSFGWFLTDQSEWGIRQLVGVSDTSNTSSRWNGATSLFYDWHYDADRWQPYLGASLGYIYGEDTH